MKKTNVKIWINSFIRRRAWRILPPFIKSWWFTRQNIAKLETGWQPIPEQELEECYVRCLEILDGMGDYLEFGVFSGSSMACMFKALKRTGRHDVRLFGFDSFEGLPRDEDGWKKGEYCMNLRNTKKSLVKKGVDLKRVTLIKGWFSGTLNDATKNRFCIHRSCLVMIDCDIYSSSKEALEFIAPILGDKSIVVFDDWNSLDSFGDKLGQKKAFPEFLERHPEFSATPFDTYGKNGKIFLVERQKADANVNS